MIDVFEQHVTGFPVESGSDSQKENDVGRLSDPILRCFRWIVDLLRLRLAVFRSACDFVFCAQA